MIPPLKHKYMTPSWLDKGTSSKSGRIKRYSPPKLSSELKDDAVIQVLSTYE